VANTNRGLYVKAAQFIASIRGGTGERGVPKAYTDALAKFTDHAPHKSINDVAETGDGMGWVTINQ
jgi:predicted unusual protein kinase regulating ubiquinone biosynthesis (AarF/ABC1/UbiB family)